MPESMQTKGLLASGIFDLYSGEFFLQKNAFDVRLTLWQTGKI